MYKSLNMVVVGWKEIYQTSKKKEKNHEGGKRKKGRVEGWVLVEGYRHGVGGGGAEQLAWSTALWGNLRCFRKEHLRN